MDDKPYLLAGTEHLGSVKTPLPPDDERDLVSLSRESRGCEGQRPIEVTTDRAITTTMRRVKRSRVRTMPHGERSPGWMAVTQHHAFKSLPSSLPPGSVSDVQPGIARWTSRRRGEALAGRPVTTPNRTGEDGDTGNELQTGKRRRGAHRHACSLHRSPGDGSRTGHCTRKPDNWQNKPSPGQPCPSATVGIVGLHGPRNSWTPRPGG